MNKNIDSLKRQIEAHGFENFTEAMETQIKLLEENTADRLILEYLLKNAKGAAKAKSWKRINAHLKANGIIHSKQMFQKMLLQRSRKSTYFIGSGYKGYFVIESPTDVAVVRDFYNTRMTKELQHLQTVEFLAQCCDLIPMPIANRKSDERRGKDAPKGQL